MSLMNGMISVQCQVNGDSMTFQCAPERRLLSLLREDLQLTGAKPGCDIGRCGACMVWLDGEPVPACLVMAYQLAGRSVTTIEAIAHDDRSAEVRNALASCGGVQCGYCTAGLVMTLTHLHEQSPLPDVTTAKAQACGNLCRCTGYGGITRAIETLFPMAESSSLMLQDDRPLRGANL
jgi:carbon-monoxide dehydrogenase small subunit